jgi:hypothetical protein
MMVWHGEAAMLVFMHAAELQLQGYFISLRIYGEDGIRNNIKVAVKIKSTRVIREHLIKYAQPCNNCPPPGRKISKNNFSISYTCDKT